jgi:hypothetical protein
MIPGMRLCGKGKRLAFPHRRVSTHPSEHWFRVTGVLDQTSRSRDNATREHRATKMTLRPVVMDDARLWQSTILNIQLLQEAGNRASYL